MTSGTVSVVLPSYNERDNVPVAIERLCRVLGDSLLEVVIVDDDSPDRTWEVVESLRNPKARVIRRVGEKGLASALARGVSEAKGDFIVWMDCDLGLPPEDVPRLLAGLKDHDVVIGSRYAPGGKDTQPIIRSGASVLMNGFARLCLGRGVRDYTSGFVAVRREVLRSVSWNTDGFGEYFIEFAFRCQRQGFRVTEVGYVYAERLTGKSTIGTSLPNIIRYGWKYGLRILRMAMERVRMAVPGTG